MNRLLVAGLVLFGIGIVGYLLGIETPYPGRSFAVTAVMVGITFVAIGRANGFQEDFR